MNRNISIITMVGAVKYDTTTYKFDDGKVSSETTIFSNALIERYRDRLKTVVFLGTETSSWSAILPDPETEKDKEFFERLKNNESVRSNRHAISREDFEILRKRLKSYYLDFDVHVLPPQKSNINLEENPLDVYSKIIDYVKNTEIVFDITSAFRYMPLFIFESLQTYSPDFDVNDITLLYAEKNENSNECYQVRDISEVWRAAEINKVLYTFQTTLDGSKLAIYLERAGERKLASYIKKFSDSIQKGFMALCDYDFFKELKEIIDSIDAGSVNFTFVRETINFLDNKIIPSFDYLEDYPESNRRAWCLYTLAEILNTHGLYSQAIISLRESVYMQMIEKKEPELLSHDKIKPDELKVLEDSYKIDLKKTHLWGKWWELKEYRNYGAHAGIELIGKDGEKESSENFRKFQKTAKDILEKVIK